MQTTKKQWWVTVPATLLILAALTGCPTSEDDPERTEITGVNLALSAKASAPGTSKWHSNPEENAAFVNDGIMSLAYVSMEPTLPEDVVLTWAQPQTFNTIVYYVWYAQGQGIIDVTISVSSDGETWKTVLTETGLTYKYITSRMEQKIFQFPKETATMLKLRVTRMNEEWLQYVINELEVSLEAE